MTKVGILIYPKVEVLDFCGPFEVFRNVETVGKHPISIYTISERNEPIDAQGLSINPDHDFQTCPQLDILIVPGGNGRWLVEQAAYLEFVTRQTDAIQHLVSVCTGALLVAKAKLLEDGMAATTHMEGMEYLQELAPNARVLPDVRFTDNGKIIMSGGISAGIDSSLYLVKKLWGEQLARQIALYMEYDWNYTKSEQEYIRPVID
ncbi:MAG: DJ-1/PfpI family protein [Candidatus Kariarchaeaceae archaeon]|jgi:transcriptional regulator GlxA family with amidase domain